MTQRSVSLSLNAINSSGRKFVFFYCQENCSRKLLRNKKKGLVICISFLCLSILTFYSYYNNLHGFNIGILFASSTSFFLLFVFLFHFLWSQKVSRFLINGKTTFQKTTTITTPTKTTARNVIKYSLFNGARSFHSLSVCRTASSNSIAKYIIYK